MKVIVIPIAYNEEKKIGSVISRIREARCCDKILLVDDGSTDDTPGEAHAEGAEVLTRPERGGAGAALRSGFAYAKKHGFDTVVVTAGNNKDEPLEIPRLVDPIEKGEADFVQGSRYLPGGRFGRMPFYRQLATRFVHPWFFSLLVKRRLTDTTNGFRAIRMSLLNDERIDLDQHWLNHYELEPYLLYKAITLGYKVKEVPVTKIYPPKELGYSKIKPITGWWSMLRPLVLLGLGVKK